VKAKPTFLTLLMIVLFVVAQLTFVSPAAAQGSGCYKPCLRTYRRCQQVAGRYKKGCRQRFVHCWRGCDRAVGMGHNPVPRP
jgi:hypothetical protein